MFRLVLWCGSDDSEADSQQNVTTFLNTKEVKNRNEDRPEITYITSGNMNKDKYLTVSIKQKKQ